MNNNKAIPIKNKEYTLSTILNLTFILIILK